MGKENRVRTYYNAYAANYDSFYQPIQSNKFEKLADIFTIKEWVCDLGGGTGLLSDWLQYPILTVDLSLDMLKIGLLNNRPCCPVAGDIQKLPIRSNSISTLYSITTLQNIPREEKALKEIKRIFASSYFGIITFLKKSPNASKLSNLFDKSIEVSRLSHFTTEDLGYILSNSELSSSGS